MKKKINTHKAPAAIGPYSQGIETDTLIFLSGQIPLDPETMELVTGEENQIRQVFKNIAALCEEVDLNNFQKQCRINQKRKSYQNNRKP